VLATLHRFRSSYLAERTARINTTRGVLREIGIFIPTGARHVVLRVRTLIEDPKSTVPHALRFCLREACEEIGYFEAEIRKIERRLQLLSRDNPIVELLQTIPGIGLLSATALVAFVGDIRRFNRDKLNILVSGLYRYKGTGSIKRRRVGCMQ